MPRVATLNRQIPNPDLNMNDEQNNTEELNGSEKKRNAYNMRALKPEMVSDPYPLDFADGMDSLTYAMERCRQVIIDPLRFKSVKEYLEFCKQSWLRAEDIWDKEAEGEASKVEQEVQKLLAKTEGRAKLNQLVKEKVAALVEAE